MRDDIDKLREAQHLLVGTLGRVFDMFSKRHLRIDDLIAFVLDQAEVKPLNEKRVIEEPFMYSS